MALIEREALLAALNIKHARHLIQMYVQQAPTIDAAPKLYQTWEDVPDKLPLYARPGRGKPNFAYLHKSAQALIPQLAWARAQTDADFRAITPPGFARAFYQANK